jgi:hypothetical protein
MTVTQTVEIPADRRIMLEVPSEIPPGRTILTFTPVANACKVVENLRGAAKKMGSTLTTERFLEMRRDDLNLEEERYRKFAQE